MTKLIKYALSAILGIGISYNANALSFTLHDEFSGGAQPAGSIKVDITNAATGVDLKISSLLVGTEFLGSLYLNLNPLYNPTTLVFGAPTRTGTFGTNPAISLGTDAFKADGDGKYDILFDFDIAPPGDRFNLLDTITYNITRAGGLTEADFDYLSAPDGGHGPFKAAAHIQGIPPDSSGDTSGWIAPNGVPDGGATVMLLGTALAGLGALRRRLA